MSKKKNQFVWRTQFNPEYQGVFDSHQDQEDVITVPDMHIPLRTLLAKHSQGIDIPVGQEPQYHGDLEIPSDYDLSDPVDIANFISDLESRKNSILEEINQKNQTSGNDELNDDSASIKSVDETSEIE